MITVMEELGSALTQTENTQVLVTFFDRALLGNSIRIVNMLRDAGISAEFYFSPDKLKKQLSYAAAKAIPHVVILGPDEDREGMVVLRNMQDGSQASVPQTGLVDALRRDPALS